MRELSAPAIAAIAAGTVVPVALVEMDLDGGSLYLNHTRLQLTIDGKTYEPTHGLGEVGQVSHTGAEMPTLALKISGSPSDKIALALSEPVQGRELRFSVALFDSASGAVLATSRIFAGWLNVMTITDGRERSEITVTAEAGVRDLLRACNVLFTHADQQITTPGDLAFQYVNHQVEQEIIFPAASWFKHHKD